MSQPYLDLESQSNEEILAFSKSFEATEATFQGSKLPLASAGYSPDLAVLLG